MKTIPFLIRMNSETHTAIQVIANNRFASMNYIINAALIDYCKNHGEIMISNGKTNISDCKVAVHHKIKKDDDKINRKRKN